jgi:hypothetical protein
METRVSRSESRPRVGRSAPGPGRNRLGLEKRPRRSRASSRLRSAEARERDRLLAELAAAMTHNPFLDG